MKIKKIMYITLGCIGVGLGALGAVLPLLPAFPFLLLAAVCFGKSSEKLHTWFIGTKLYKDNLESYIQGKGMTRKAKFRIMVTVTILMSISLFMMLQVPVGRIILGCVWVFHVPYFAVGVKTIPSESPANPQAGTHQCQKVYRKSGGYPMTNTTNFDAIEPTNPVSTSSMTV